MLKWLTDNETGWLGNPTKFRKLNGWLAVCWAIMGPLALITGWIFVIAFLGAISIYANFGTHVAAWAGSRAEEAQAEDDAVQREDIVSLERKIDDLHDELVNR